MKSIKKFDYDINDKKTENLCKSDSYQTVRLQTGKKEKNGGDM